MLPGELGNTARGGCGLELLPWKPAEKEGPKPEDLILDK